MKKKKIVFIKTPRTKWYTDDVIAVLLASLDTQYITTNGSKIHKAVFELKRKYPEFFNDLIFSGNEIHPFSKELETILFRFYQTNVLSALNPSFDVYFIDKDKKIEIKRHLNDRFSKGDKRKIREMSELIKSEKLLSE
jgi:hypothetical protein